MTTSPLGEQPPRSDSRGPERAWGRERVLAAVAGLALLVLLAILAIGLSRGVGQSDSGITDGGGATAAPFEAPRYSPGDDPPVFVLDQHADQPVFVYFWASWCAPCREEGPLIESLWPEYRDRGYYFVGVNIWDLERDAQAFIDEFDLHFPLVRDAERNIYLEYGVQALPVGFFIEPGLRIRSRYDGALDEATLRGLLDELAPDQAVADRR